MNFTATLFKLANALEAMALTAEQAGKDATDLRRLYVKVGEKAIRIEREEKECNNLLEK